MEPRPISNSEVGSWLQCTQRWYFEYVRKIEPKKHGRALSIGILGHAALEAYGLARIAGHSHKQAEEIAKAEVLQPAMQVDIEFALKVQDILTRYHAYRQGFPEWKFVGVEERHDLTMTDEFSQAMRYDIFVEDLQDRGKLKLVDYKFTYDFWSRDDHDQNIQFPKYIAILRANGKAVEGAYIEELRYRDMKDMSHDKHFKRTRYEVNIPASKNALRQHIKASRQISEYFTLSEEEQQDQIIPIHAKHICKMCGFRQLCITQLNGGDIEYAVQTQFKDRTYGYAAIDNTVEETVSL